MTASTPAGFGPRLYRVAVGFVVSGHGPRVSEAVVLAEDMVAAGFVGDAILQVAVLRRDTARSDAELLVRRMLVECGIDLPLADDEKAEQRLLLKAFGFWDLPVGDFYSPFLDQFGAWDQQDDLARTLMRLFEELDDATDPSTEDEIVRRMRVAVRDALS